MRTATRVFQFFVIAAALCGLLAGDSPIVLARGIMSAIVTMAGVSCITDSNSANCVLLIHSNTTDGSTTFVDSSDSNHTADITVVNNTHHETDQHKFGTSSIEFDSGVPDKLTIADSTDWDFGVGDFCVELWVYFNTINTGLLGRYSNAAGNWALEQSGNKLYWYYGAGVSWNRDWTPSAGQWYHVCVARASGTLRIFVNGTQLGADQADATDYGTAEELTIGDYRSAQTNRLDGYLDEIVIWKGSAHGRTANFTPPTAAYCD